MATEPKTVMWGHNKFGDTALWLHNKLGTSNDSWTSGSICSQLNKDVLKSIKECFTELQTPVKLKLLLSFFYIPRRLVEEWKTELEEIIEVAGSDPELWVSMIAETIKTFPTTGSLNTELSDYDDARPIFSDMVNDLRKLVNKHFDLGMLPLECQYLNKTALISVVGQQPAPVKHFTLKRNPKSATLRAELLQKSSDAQSSLKKSSAPTIPLRSRGMPRKMTDTTPLKGIPSRVPTSGFRSPTSTPGQNRPNMSRTQAGRKDGGIKLLDITEQPLGYAAAKKRKRQQELEEQQKRAIEAQNNITNNNNNNQTTNNNQINNNNNNQSNNNDNNVISIKSEKPDSSVTATISTATSSNPITTTPDYAVGLNTTSIYTQPQPKLEPNVLPSSTQSTITAVSTVSPVGTTTVIANQIQTIVTLTSTNVIDTVSTSSIFGGTTSTTMKNVPIISTEMLPTPTKENITILTTSQIPQLQQQQQQQHQQLQQQQQKLQHQSSIVGTTQFIKTEFPKSESNSIQNPVTKIEMLPTPELINIKNEINDKNDIKIKFNTSNINNNNNINRILVNDNINNTNNHLNNLTTTIIPTSFINTIQKQHVTQINNNLLNTINNSNINAITSNNNHIVVSIKPNSTFSTLPTLTNPSTILTTTNKNLLASLPASTIIAKQTPKTIRTVTTITPTTITPSYVTTTVPYNQNISKFLQQQKQQQQQHSTNNPMPTLTAISSSLAAQQQLQQPLQIPSQIGSTKIVQIKTAPTIQMVSNINTSSSSTTITTTPRSSLQNIPPLIPTQQVNQQQHQPSILNIHNVSLSGNTIQTSNASNIQYITTTQQQQQQTQSQQYQQTQQQPRIIQLPSSTSNYSQILMSPSTLSIQKTTGITNTTGNVTIASSGGGTGTVNVTGTNNIGKTIILTSPNPVGQKTVIIRTVGPDGNMIYQQVPISNVTGLSNLTTTSSPTIIKTTQPTQQLQQQQQHIQTLPALVPTSNYSQNITALTPVIIASHNDQQQQQQQQHTQQSTLPTLITNLQAQNQQIHQQPQTIHIQQQNATQPTIIRPVIVTNNQGGVNMQSLNLQGLRIIQRPGQQPQLVQTIQQNNQQQPQQIRSIITQQPQQQQQQIGQIQIRQQPQQQIIHIQPTQQQSQQLQQIQQQNPRAIITQQQLERKGITLSSEQVVKAQELFHRANQVTRLDKALILSFMGGCRDNPRPSKENVIDIKLNETEQKLEGSNLVVSVESLIKLDYNTGHWSTYQRLKQSDQQIQQSQQQQNTSQKTQNSVVM